MGGESLLGPIPGLILLGFIIVGALFYYLSKPAYHPWLGEKIVRADERFAQYEADGHTVYTARYQLGIDENQDGIISKDEEDRPSTRALFLYFKAKGYPPDNDDGDEYRYIALPPTRNDWVIEFFLWLLIPLVAALVMVGEKVFKLAIIVVFVYIIIMILYGVIYIPTNYLFGSSVGVIFNILALGIVMVLIATKYRNTRLVQWVF